MVNHIGAPGLRPSGRALTKIIICKIGIQSLLCSRFEAAVLVKHARDWISFFSYEQLTQHWSWANPGGGRTTVNLFHCFTLTLGEHVFPQNITVILHSETSSYLLLQGYLYFPPKMFSFPKLKILAFASILKHKCKLMKNLRWRDWFWCVRLSHSFNDSLTNSH